MASRAKSHPDSTNFIFTKGTLVSICLKSQDQTLDAFHPQIGGKKPKGQDYIDTPSSSVPWKEEPDGWEGHF